MPRAIFLLAVNFISLVAIFKELSLGPGRARWGNRDSFLLAVTAQGALLVLLVEGLSPFKLLERDALLLGWGLSSAVFAGLWAWIRIRRTGFSRKFFNFRDWNLADKAGVSRSNALLVAVGGLILLTLALVAYVYPPTNWDSMTYHLARVMHWEQNQSVANYPTSILRQLQLQPFAEYEILNLELLVNSDLYAALVQLAALLVCCIGVTNIAGKFGANPKQQLLSGLLCLSIPMAILQSTSTQNDLVAAQWLVCFACLGLSLANRPASWLWTAGTGLALGLALLTKATAYLFAIPFCIWIGFSLLKDSRLHLFKGLLILALVLLLNSGYFVRNFQLFGSPFGPQTYYTTETFTLGSLSSNLIRNTAVHFSINFGGGLQTNAVLGWLRLLNELTGYGPNDPAITSPGIENVFSGLNHYQVFNEDYAGNPLQAAAAGAVILCMVIFFAKFKSQKALLLYSGCLMAGFLVFSSYLKFQIWSSRLQLPLFILWAPAVVLVLGRLNQRILSLLVLAATTLSLLWVFGNVARPIDPARIEAVAQNRETGYFTLRPELAQPLQQITNEISRSTCHKIGLKFGEDTWEYPLWALLKNRGWTGQIEHIRVENESAALENPSFDPCAILTASPPGPDLFPGYSQESYLPYYLLQKKAVQ